MTSYKLVELGWVTPHQTSGQEITHRLRVADRNLNDCEKGISADNRLRLGHDAVIALAAAALGACGYEVVKESHHYRLLQSLEYTVGLDKATVDALDAFRKKRNLAGYDVAGTVSDAEAAEIVELAAKLSETVKGWLHAEHADLLQE